MIDINHVSLGYGKKEILTDINLRVKANSLTALIGINGAGKSSLFNCLAKQKNVNNGDIKVCGKDINNYSYNEYAKIVSLVPQFSSVAQIDYKVRDFLVEGRTPYLPVFSVPGMKEYEYSEKIAKKMEIEKYLDIEFNKLSGGEQQLILLARALVQDTQIILLDEPMSALDLKNQAFFLKIIKQLSKEGKTVIFSTHNPNHALVLDCDVCIIHNRKVFCNGKASEILSKDVITDIYGTETCIYENAGRKYCEITFE